MIIYEVVKIILLACVGAAFLAALGLALSEARDEWRDRQARHHG